MGAVYALFWCQSHPNSLVLQYRSSPFKSTRPRNEPCSDEKLERLGLLK